MASQPIRDGRFEEPAVGKTGLNKSLIRTFARCSVTSPRSIARRSTRGRTPSSSKRSMLQVTRNYS